MRMRSIHYLLLTLPVLALGPVSCAGPSGAGMSGAPARTEPPVVSPPAAEPVVREILGQVDDTSGAAGRRLTLVRYTIAPAAELAPHVHPGVQMGSIVSGTLTYRVVSGVAIVHRAVDASGVPRSTERLEGPSETLLIAGDVVVEDDAMVHFGMNRTTEPVVILAALVTDPAQELAVPTSSPF